MTHFPEALLRSDVIGPLVVTPAFFMSSLVALGMFLWFRAKSEKARHAMLQMLVDKGEPVPAELFGARRRPAGNDLRRGVTLLTMGIGLGLALIIVGEPRSAGFALIPVLMGVGYLVVWNVEKKSAGREER